MAYILNEDMTPETHIPMALRIDGLGAAALRSQMDGAISREAHDTMCEILTASRTGDVRAALSLRDDPEFVARVADLMAGLAESIDNLVAIRDAVSFAERSTRSTLNTRRLSHPLVEAHAALVDRMYDAAREYPDFNDMRPPICYILDEAMMSAAQGRGLHPKTGEWLPHA